MKETNAAFTRHTVFKMTCKLAGLPATTRQASKYRRGLGVAVRQKQKALFLTNQEIISKLH